MSTGCGLSWSLLAGIGWIESHHGAAGGSANPSWTGTARPPILGPVLDGNGFAAVRDTDHGRLDGSTAWDRAVGPMQFIPASWRRWGADGDGDGTADPQSIDDAALAAARYLCAAGDVRSPAGVVHAVFAYNHDLGYVRAVLVAARGYGATPVLAAALASVPLSAPPAVQVTMAPTATAVPQPSTAPRATRPTQVAATPWPTPTSPSPRPGAATSSAPPVASASPSPSPAASDAGTEVPCSC